MPEIAELFSNWPNFHFKIAFGDCVDKIMLTAMDNCLS